MLEDAFVTGGSVDQSGWKIETREEVIPNLIDSWIASYSKCSGVPDPGPARRLNIPYLFVSMYCIIAVFSFTLVLGKYMSLGEWEQVQQTPVFPHYLFILRGICRRKSCVV